MIDFIAGFLAGEASFTVQTNVSKNRVYPVLSVLEPISGGHRITLVLYYTDEERIETPDCPACGEPLTYGMVDWDVHDPDGFMSGWLCESEIPARVEEGIR